MTVSKVAVVGGGVMGAAAAWQLQRRGVEVTLYEQYALGHARGSSHGGSRIFRLAYDQPDCVRLAEAALRQWRELEEAANQPLLDMTGSVSHGTEAEIELLSTSMASAGVAYEVLTAERAEERYPGMRFESRVLVQPDGGRCRADAAVGALHRLLDDVREGWRVESIRALDADVVIVAAGAWLPKVLPELALPPMVITKEQVQHFVPRDPTVVWPSFIHRHTQRGGVYGLETLGHGVKVARHRAGCIVDPDERTFQLDDEITANAVRYVEEWLPGLHLAPVHQTTCLYTNTDDGEFVLDRIGDVVVVSPCSGHGFKFAPEIGRLAANLALGESLPAAIARRFSSRRAIASHPARV